MFRHYHYLSGSLASHARCYCAVYHDEPVAFMAIMNIHMKTQYYRVHRLVVLPDYQGIGIGKRFLNLMANHYSKQTRRPFYIITSNPQLIRGNMQNWRVYRSGHASVGKAYTRINAETRASTSRNRVTVSLLYNRKLECNAK